MFLDDKEFVDAAAVAENPPISPLADLPDAARNGSGHYPSRTARRYAKNKLAFFKRDGFWKVFSYFSRQRLDNFLAKGGTINQISHPLEAEQPRISLMPGDTVYPICSGGICRSQTLWAILQTCAKRLQLLRPHAARYG